MGLTTVAMVLQCSGNGRKYMQDKVKGTEHKISGTPWSVGAAGCLVWTGVPLKAVVDALGGPADDAKFITCTGGEEIPAGVDVKDVLVERSVPLSTLDTVILAWDMNGEPIPLAHGGPLRSVVPGFTGVNSVKYVKTVNLSAQQSDAKIQATRYRMHPLGTKGSPDQPSVWELNVRSWITTPLQDLKAGRAQIAGVAFGGINAVKEVEVSVDGGKTWDKAEFVGPDLGQYAWRTFVLSKELKPGSYKLVSRATDSAGNAQPEDLEANAAGYGHNGWMALAVDLKVA